MTSGNTLRSSLWRSLAAATLSVAFSGLTSCAVDDWSTELPDIAITSEEVSAGAGDDGADHSEPVDGIDGDVALLAPPIVESDEEGVSVAVEESTACRQAAGYVSGNRRSICVTSVDGKLVERTTAVKYREMQAAARRAGVRIAIVSGFRTMEKQRELYNCYRAGRCPLAARPGYSNHQSGLALDLNTSASGVYSWLSRNASRYGFRRTVPSEAWHWERR